MTSTPAIPASAARFRINSAVRSTSASPRDPSTEKSTEVSFHRPEAEAEEEADGVSTGALDPVPAL
ncbi:MULTISPECIES: hypothetical protein [unclassified Streptomyces]|uniref:hypothetical protein n=1 Tax=unclassified Streptomyces TaxID=2593676 RepID=UPI0033BE4C0F